MLYTRYCSFYRHFVNICLYIVYINSCNVQIGRHHCIFKIQVIVCFVFIPLQTVFVGWYPVFMLSVHMFVHPLRFGFCAELLQHVDLLRLANELR